MAAGMVIRCDPHRKRDAWAQRSKGRIPGVAGWMPCGSSSSTVLRMGSMGRKFSVGKVSAEKTGHCFGSAYREATSTTYRSKMNAFLGTLARDAGPGWPVGGSGRAGPAERLVLAPDLASGAAPPAALRAGEP